MDLSETRSHAQRRHPWELARASALIEIVRRQGVRISSVLDYGCGDGFTGEAVQAAFRAKTLVGVDVHLPPEACGTRVTAAGSRELLRDDESLGVRRFDLVLLCDVIEHVREDTVLLSRVVNRWLAPGGLVLVTVPAFQVLFSAHDRALKHYRRYDARSLHRVIRASELECIEHGFLFGSLLPFRAASTLVERLRRQQPERDHGIGGWKHGKLLSSTLTLGLQFDNAILLASRKLGLRLPGLTAWALCKTP